MPSSSEPARRRLLFITGRLAENALREVVADLAGKAGFDYSIQVMPITVAALMTPAWIARHISVPEGVTEVVLPGYCRGDLAALEQAAGVPVRWGPKDLRMLPEFFGRPPDRADYGQFDIQILAEINLAPRLPLADLVAEADRLRAQGADLIDLGCVPGETWQEAFEAVRVLRAEGHRVSIDSYDPAEIGPAVSAGVELVLSVNRTNLQHAADWGCEVVVVPDVPGTLDGLHESLEFLSTAKVPFRVDPILSPIAFGFAESLGRYLEARRRWPEAEMLMGIGNLTELTDADSAPINVLLVGFCQELAIRSVLTTQVIPWARTSVRECDLARKLVHYAVSKQVLPKHLEPGLVMLRDPAALEHGERMLAELAAALKDHAYRIFAERGRLHLMTAGVHLEGSDPFELFDALLPRAPRPIGASHAFYLGYEMAKATIALTLGKNYRQDEALDWGLLTVPESTRADRHARRTDGQTEGPGEC